MKPDLEGKWFMIAIVAAFVAGALAIAVAFWSDSATKQECIRAGLEVVNGDCVRRKP